MFGINIEEKLSKIKERELKLSENQQLAYQDLLKDVHIDDEYRRDILNISGFKHQDYVKKNKPEPTVYTNEKYQKLCDKFGIENVFHIKDITQLAINYRLRFLENKYYIGHLPDDIHLDIAKVYKLDNELYSEENPLFFKQTEKERKQSYFVLAPRKLFALENAKLQPKPVDPILFLKKDDFYIKIKKWGYDLNPFRYLTSIPFRSEGHQIISKIILIGILMTISILTMLSFSFPPVVTFFGSLLFVALSIPLVWATSSTNKSSSDFCWNEKEIW